MTPERARYILDNTVYGNFKFAFRKKCDMPGSTVHEDGITEAEDAYVLKLWKTMPGWTTYYHAVCRIARGEALYMDQLHEAARKLHEAAKAYGREWDAGIAIRRGSELEKQALEYAEIFYATAIKQQTRDG